VVRLVAKKLSFGRTLVLWLVIKGTAGDEADESASLLTDTILTSLLAAARRSLSSQHISETPLLFHSPTHSLSLLYPLSTHLLVSRQVVMDRETGRSRGFGFVTYAEVQDADIALKEMEGFELDGRNIHVSKPNPRGAGGGGGMGTLLRRGAETREWSCVATAGGSPKARPGHTPSSAC
jgi:hypothetical protein